MKDGRTEVAKLAIVGGGAAGMFAAAVAAERHIPCVVFERKARLGSKVLMTANGRCNFAKDITPEQFLKDLQCCGLARYCADFVAEAVKECPPRRIVSGFKSLGVRVKRMSDGRVFPADEKAATIVHAFGDLLRDEEVPIVTNCPVREIVPVRDGRARLRVVTRAFSVDAENVILATGGVSYPKTGSVGDGQDFARTLGHTIAPYRPGLIGIETDDPVVARFAGRRFEGETCRVLDGSGRIIFEYRGEVDCETFGLSGAAVYNAQRFIEHLAREGGAAKSVTVEVTIGRESVSVPNPRPRPLKEAIVTIGGVALSEIDPRTMQSRIVPGLYFAGEVMDIDGPTGGYNLTLAFATARKAVASIS